MMYNDQYLPTTSRSSLLDRRVVLDSRALEIALYVGLFLFSIFLHLWQAPNRGTAGCTAMGESDMRALMRWLDPTRNPVLIQLPLAEITALLGPLPSVL